MVDGYLMFVFSIRLGVFLRRYPIARIFVIVYMVSMAYSLSYNTLMLVHLCHHDCVGSASGDVTPVNVVSHLSAGDVSTPVSSRLCRLGIG